MGRTGILFIVSGPSGAGKSAIASALLGSIPNLQFSISYTTRAPRGQERNGKEYHFVQADEFQSLIKNGELLEWAEVYGNLYGTSRRAVQAILAGGNDVLLDIDVQGAHNIRETCPDAVSVFILPPSYQVLRERLERRQLDKDYVIEQRLKIAGREIKHYRDYDYLVINENLDEAIEELRAIILAFRCRIAARAAAAREIVETFGGMDD